MKAVLSIILLGVFVCIAKDTYTTKYDNVDIDQILRNERLLKKYVECLKGRPGCSKDGELLKGK